MYSTRGNRRMMSPLRKLTLARNHTTSPYSDIFRRPQASLDVGRGGKRLEITSQLTTQEAAAYKSSVQSPLMKSYKDFAPR